jgi:hypothetical protein
VIKNLDPTAPKFRQGMEKEYLPEIEIYHKRSRWCQLSLRSCVERSQCDWCRKNLELKPNNAE